MSDVQETNIQTTTGTPRWVGLVVAILGCIALLGVGVGWTALNHVKNVEQSTQASLKQADDATSQRLARSEEQNQQLQTELKAIADKLNVTQADLVAARKQSKFAVVSYNKKLTGLETSVKNELATKASSEDISKLNGDVTGVKGDLDATKNSIQMARSEMGTLIARNHDEIDQLRRLGERDYYEFTVQRKAGPQRIGAIQVALKGTNVKKNQYTVDVLADDKNFEKKNRSVNEPIFFYTGGSRSTLELVVNKVTKTTATGYLSVPKSAGAASSNKSSSGQ
ncbi:MAG TPA: hypothetical protein VN982_02460 [Candidatus Dormibacteraeota bacterium]|nr:hypothetical protein [Candidatus Dormibacteraeota bacterium]